jgi:hypothetical protein
VLVVCRDEVHGGEGLDPAVQQIAEVVLRLGGRLQPDGEETQDAGGTVEASQDVVRVCDASPVLNLKKSAAKIVNVESLPIQY